MTWTDGALPSNASKWGFENTSVVMFAGHNYYWSETWAVASSTANSDYSVKFRQDPGKMASRMPAGPHSYFQGSVGFLDEACEFAVHKGDDGDDFWLHYWPRSGSNIDDLEIYSSPGVTASRFHR